MSVVLALYGSLVVLCAAVGLHRVVLTLTWLGARARVPVGRSAEVPVVTVQLPVFNERDVVARLVDAAAALDWPSDRLELQLLDDSTDDTCVCAAPAIERARARGVDIQVIRRTERAGFKAGALANGLRVARGELIAVFDADFVPAPDFLRATVPHFTDGVGMVQARWSHLNAGRSWLTRAQAALLDGHFVIEHTARCRGGNWFNFNGTAGVWRRSAIEAAGGWQSDTLTEDLDLSYRAQLAGWRFVYLLEYDVPAEIPESISAFRVQQRRWAKGSVEVALKLVPRILRADVPLGTRLEAVAHLTANLGWLASLGIALLLPVCVFADLHAPGLFAATFLVTSGAHLVFYGLAAGWRRVLPALVLGVGMTVNQVGAVVEALAGHRTAFVRTPKTGGGHGSYRVTDTMASTAEIGLALLQVTAVVWAVAHANWAPIPFLLLLTAGYGWTGIGGAWERLTVPRLSTGPILPASAGQG